MPEPGVEKLRGRGPVGWAGIGRVFQTSAATAPTDSVAFSHTHAGSDANSHSFDSPEAAGDGETLQWVVPPDKSVGGGKSGAGFPGPAGY